MKTHINGWLKVFLLLLCWCVTKNSFSLTPASATTEDPNLILFYISHSWKGLERSMSNCSSLSDSKTKLTSTLYLPHDLPIPESVFKLKQHCALTVKRLPKKIKKLGELNVAKIHPSGLLYLPNAYIVPGGRFNEMYGWDSYFIIRGLIESNKLNLAYGMLENFFFEIDHYGGTLNGNRTYFLSRSQLPFLAPVIRAIYEADKKREFTDPHWLAKAYAYAVKDYTLWLHPSHLAGKTNLSRYYDFGRGPVSEMDDSPRSYYSDVIHYFLVHPEIARPYLLLQKNLSQQRPPGSFFNVFLCKKKSNGDNKACKLIKNIGLTNRFYQGDRAMRESGFDTSFRFGTFSADTLDYAPVDLNSLLYRAELDLEWMSKELNMPQNMRKWHARARLRREKINKYLWNNKRGMYFDYNFKTKRQSAHPYASTFYPLWAGLASRYQAKKLIRNLKFFEKPGGIVTSLRETGAQWDYPYGWAPIQLITIEGLYGYGFNEDAHRISTKFLKMIIKNFLQDKTIREKYNVVTSSSKTDIKIGYTMNVIGFGWTNGVFLVLLNKLPPDLVKTQLGIDLQKIEDK